MAAGPVPATRPAIREPKDKHDREAFDEMAKLPAIELIPELPMILEWIMDANWPVAHDVLAVVDRFVNEGLAQHLVGPILDILKSDDEGWKQNCFDHIVWQLPREQQLQLRPEIERIALQPTPLEAKDGTDQEAKNLLEEHIDFEEAEKEEKEEEGEHEDEEAAIENK